MKTSLTKRLGCFVLVLLTIASLSLPAFAASGSLDKTVKEKIPNLNNVTIKGFGYKTTGTIKCYTDSSLSKRGSAWISLRYDECTIERVANNGRALYIKFPVGGGRYLKRWFSTKDFLGINSLTAKFPAYTVIKKMTTYQRSNGGAKYGYAAAGDRVYVLSAKTYITILYPLVSGDYKIGHVKSSDFQKCTASINDTKSFSPVWPCKKASQISTLYRYWNGGNVKNHGVRSTIYNAFDISGASGDSIYAIEGGTVVEKGYQAKGFGYYVVIDHGNGLRSLYGHLKKAAIVNKGAKVSRGQLIGYLGSSGNSTGPHLHFEVYDAKNLKKVINPWVTYYQGKVSVTIGGNSYRANQKFVKTDAYAKAWCNWLKNNCKKNASGDYVFKP